MKKKILLFLLTVLISTKIFAGEYVYWEDHKTSYSGKTTVHLKICFPKGFNNNEAANEYLQKTMNDFLNLNPPLDSQVTLNVTEVWLSNGTFYRIFFFILSNGTGCVTVAKGNGNYTEGTPLEKIYENWGSYFSTYNDFYEIYQNQCNKYLDML